MAKATHTQVKVTCQQFNPNNKKLAIVHDSSTDQLKKQIAQAFYKGQYDEHELVFMQVKLREHAEWTVISTDNCSFREIAKFLHISVEQEIPDETIELDVEFKEKTQDEADEPVKKKQRKFTSMRVLFNSLKPIEADHWMNHITRDTPFFDLSEWINSDLSSKIKLCKERHDSILDMHHSLKTDASFNNNFTIDQDEQVPASFQCEIENVILFASKEFINSESFNVSVYDFLFTNVINHFKEFIDFRQDRNRIEKCSSFSIISTRPDYLFFLGKILIIRGEEKAQKNGGIIAARKALFDKLGSMEDEFFGQVPFLFGYAASESLFEMYAFPRKPGTIREHPMLFNLNLHNPSDRVKLIVKTIKLLVLVDNYRSLLLGTGIYPFGMYDWTDLGRKQGRDQNLFLFQPNGVHKHVAKLPEGVQFDNWISIYNYLTEEDSQELTDGRQNVIRRVISDANKSKQVKKLPLNLHLVPFCSASKSINNMSELITCLLHVSKGLEYLHSKRILHRDLRWSNILFDNKSNNYIIIDFEHAARAPRLNFTEIPKTFRTKLPTEFMLPGSKENTYRYSFATEICSLGLMVKEALKGPVESLGYLLSINLYNHPRARCVDFRLLHLIIDLTLHEDEQKRPTAPQLHAMLACLQKIVSALYLLNNNQNEFQQKEKELQESLAKSANFEINQVIEELARLSR